MNKNVLWRTLMLVLVCSLTYVAACEIMGYPLLGYSRKDVSFVQSMKTKHDGEMWPDFQLSAFEGLSPSRVEPMAIGKPIVLFYFGPECPYCQAEVDAIISNMKHLRDIQFFLVTAHPLSAVKTFSDRFKLNRFNNIVLAQDGKQKVKTYFEIPGVPFLAIYSKEGRLNASFLGLVGADQIKYESEK